ncbi:MAG: efflux RND transporter permease subunit, partial [Verrucomicrobiota bacterium]|nr:efflux RND transporter permease subunit [Verrucomicrobiota bacterium]
LVDSSIVVLESIYRCREEGDSIRNAAIRGTKEVRGAVIASTLTSICVFFPMVFVEGLAGQVFSDLGLTVVTSLIASLIVAVLFIPMLASRSGFQLKSGVGMASHFFGSIEGRLSLSAFWLRFILPAVVLLGAMIGLAEGYTAWMISAVDDPRFEKEIVSYGLVALSSVSVWQFVCFVPFVIALAKRLHDFNQSAWWLATLTIPPLLVLVWFGLALIFPVISTVIAILIFPFTFIPLGIVTLICLIIPGNKVENRYGLSNIEDQSLAKIWGSFKAFENSYKGIKTVFSRYRIPELYRFAWVFTSLYFALRLAISFLLELVGLSLVWLFRAVAFIALVIYRLITIIGSISGLALNKIFEGKSDGDPAAQKGIYHSLIRWAINSPASMIALAIACFFITYSVGRQLDTELLPEVHQSEFTFEVALPVGTPLDQTVKILGEVEKKILESKKNEDSKIDTLLVMYGFDTSNMKRSDEGEHSARFKVLLKETKTPYETEELVIAKLRELFDDVPDITTRVTRPVLFSSKKPVVIQINGEELPELKEYSDQSTALLSKESELTDVEPTLRSGAPEVQIIYDRQQIIRHGLNINSIANQVRDMVKGSEATRLNRRDRRVPIVVRLSKQDRGQVADVGQLTVNPSGETPIPLNAVAELTVGEGPSEIRRIDGKRVALVQANIGAGSLGSAVETAKRVLMEKVDWPGYMDFFITGQNKEWERSRTSLYLALGLSLFLVYVIMASQFESLTQPLIIMFTIPMAFVGTVLGLEILGINLSVVVFLGMIMLAGIVVNNAIVLVDYANTLRGRGIPLKEAIIQAGCVRLRPILMTTATTVLGLLPMAIGLGDGAEIRTPMAVAVISGLLTSTILTLLVIPTIYYLFALVGERFFQSVEE